MAGVEGNIVISAASVDIGGDVGYIKEGATITPSFELYLVEGIEGLLTSPVARRTKESYSITFNLLEPTLDNIKTAWDVQNAIGAGPDPLPLNFGGDAFMPSEVVLKILTTVPGGATPPAALYVRTVTFSKAVVQAAGEIKFSQFGETLVPTTFIPLWDNANTRLGEFSDATT